MSVIETKDLWLKEPDEGFARELADFYVRNRDFFRPFDPVREDAFFTEAWQRGALEVEAGQVKRGESRRFYLFSKQRPGRIAGMVGLSGIVRGCFLSCHMGYKIDGDCLNRGYATQAVSAVVDLAFGEMGLHRVEINVMPRNAASRRVAAKCGFAEEGLARNYLRINGAWEDHIHMVQLNESM